jgi:Domain of unknown function (DUF1707)
MAMRYDVRTGMIQPDEPAPIVPGWPIPGSYSRLAPGPHRYCYDLRIGDAERDETMAQLREHFAAGRLTLDELTERIDGALAAKTQAHIDALLVDLPRSSRHPARVRQSAEDASDTARYFMAMLVLFALAALVLLAVFVQLRGGGGVGGGGYGPGYGGG